MEERLISEADVMNTLGLKKQELASMRQKGLKYVRVSKVKRLYFLTHLYEWAKSNTMQQDQAQ